VLVDGNDSLDDATRARTVAAGRLIFYHKQQTLNELAQKLDSKRGVRQLLHYLDQNPALHDADNSHPALAGSYLAACVFLIALLDEDPVGIDTPVKGLDNKTAALLQQSAWDIFSAI